MLLHVLPKLAAILAMLPLSTSYVTASADAAPGSITIELGEPQPFKLRVDLAALAQDETLSLGGFPMPGHVEVPPARPFLIAGNSKEDALECLTAAVYHEARSEGEAGQRAVAQVVLNRVRHPEYPATICGVVYQGAERRTGCQFSFTCDGSLTQRRERYTWTDARRIAEEAIAGYVHAPVGHATHYHTSAVRPVWAAELRKLTTVGAHIFYRWRGSAGEPAAFVRRTAS